MTRRILTLVALLLSCALSCSAKTVYVKWDSPGPTFDGTSWETAFHTVAAGLNAASSADEVWVAKGAYIELITLKDGVGLYGGFLGVETARDQRDYRANETILDGDKKGIVVTAINCQSAGSLISGFAVRSGSSGLYCYGSSLVISNNTITGNRSDFGTNAGIRCQGGSPTISGNVIVGNGDASVGGICLESQSSATVVGNTVRANYGTGIRCDSSEVTVIGNTIIGNNGVIGGGIRCGSQSALIERNIISGNHALDGGGVCVSSGLSTAAIYNNVITGNSAKRGGGICCINGARPTIANNTVTGNSAWGGGGGFCCVSSAPVVANNIFAFNSSGVSSSGTAASFRNNCVHGNVGYDYSGVSAGIGDVSADPLLANADYRNVHIQPGSPCKDAGDDGSALPISQDMDGQPRTQGSHVDIGADESDGTASSGDQHVIIRVSPSGNNTNDGSSWALAKATVQAGIDAASMDGGEVWVQEGAYNECITLHSNVYLYGGFDGAESRRSERDSLENTTVLDGGGADAVVVTVIAGYLVSTLDGFAVRNGSRGAISCSNSSPIIRSNTIKGNQGSGGGGISCYYSAASIVDNTITHNQASNGGAIWLFYSPATISGNTITANTATSNGGAIYCERSEALLTSNVIAANSAFILGGGMWCDYSSPILINDTFQGNSAAAIDCDNSCPTILNTIVAFNVQGIRCTDTTGTPVLRNNCVFGNTSRDYSGISAGPDSISLDPLLADVRRGNLHIQPASPCVNRGCADPQALPSMDFDGQPRMLAGAVDIGADESDGTTWATEPYAVVRVSPDGSDINDGSSWQAAKRTVQAAVNAASEQGGEVWVKAGTYVERITLYPYAYLFGGFAGNETLRTERDWIANQSVLDGGGGGTVVSVTAGNCVSTLDGFTIRNGSSSTGAGVYCMQASPTVENNTIVGNTGKGISCAYCAPSIISNVIAASSLSGISCTKSEALILGNTITGNGENGIYCSSAQPTVANNTIAFNGSGVYANSGSLPTLHSNCVYGNVAYSYSGIAAGTGDISADPLFVDRAAGNFHLTSSSPCIDAGWNEAPGLPPFDIDGQHRVMNGLVDIGVDEYLVGDSLRSTKVMRDGAQAWLDGVIVTVAFDGCFYIEAEDRSCGIQVAKADHGVLAGDKVNVTGMLKTNADGERYIEASTVEKAGTGSIAPLHINPKALGGGDWFYNPATGAGQQGIVGGVGLNNIGLLVTTWGKISYLEGAYALDLGTDDTAKILAEGIGFTGKETYARVTGISSCYKDADGLHPTIRVTSVTPLE